MISGFSHLSTNAAFCGADELRAISGPFISACERFEGLPTPTVFAVVGLLLLSLAVVDIVSRRRGAR